MQNPGDYDKSDFIRWLVCQTQRDDLVGDIATDVKTELNNNLITEDIGYKKLYSRIKTVINPDYWDVNNMEEHGFEKFEESGEEPPPGYNPFVNPLVCLKIAWHEYKTGDNIVDGIMCRSNIPEKYSHL